MAVNAPEEEQTNLVAALRDKVRRPSYFSPPKTHRRLQILHTVQAARNPSTQPARAEMKLRNVNMFLNGLVRIKLPAMGHTS